MPPRGPKPSTENFSDWLKRKQQGFKKTTVVLEVPAPILVKDLVLHLIKLTKTSVLDNTKHTISVFGNSIVVSETVEPENEEGT